MISANFHKHVKPAENGCLLWTAATNAQGYGRFRHDGKIHLAHRYAYEATHGVTLKPNECACHRCDNPTCVNVEHLFVGSRSENHRDMVNKHRHGYGSRHWNSRLCEYDVRRIRDLVASDHTQAVISQMFGVARQTVSDISRGKRWERA